MGPLSKASAIITFNENHSLTHQSYLKLADILTGGQILSQIGRTDLRMKKGATRPQIL
jgi:heme oxygenase